MRKFIGTFKKPCRVMAGTPQRAEWNRATLETHPQYFGAVRFVVTDEGDVWMFKEKYTRGVGFSRAAGGKWDRVLADHFAYGESIDEWLARWGAVPASFRGCPSEVLVMKKGVQKA